MDDYIHINITQAVLPTKFWLQRNSKISFEHLLVFPTPSFRQAHASGMLSHLTLTFGVQPLPNTNQGLVTDALRDRAGHLWKLLQRNATVYVCGGASVSLGAKSDMFWGGWLLLLLLY